MQIKLTNEQYDAIKTIALLLTPLLAFLASVTNIWHLPHAEEIVATLTAIDTLIGAFVVVINRQYHKEDQDE